MRSVLAPAGSMVHTCPNYHVPYEPHFGIPLVPGVPSATRFVLPGRIASSGLWRSLNFVTSTGLRRTARRAGLTVEFEPGEDGAGAIIVTLAGDGALRLEVEALDVALKDVTRPYRAPSGHAPGHSD